jgi:tetratricopeptide (TPR) repeat protein
MNFFALLNNRRGQRYLDTGALDRAATAFERAIHHAPDWSVPWYNLGLAYKCQRRWPESLRCNLRAAELDPTDEAAWWNTGIAATALGE